MIFTQKDILRNCISKFTSWRGQFLRCEKIEDIEAIACEKIKDFDEPFESTYSGPVAPCICIWTKDFVYYVKEYDGTERLMRLPRNPVPIPPKHK